MSAPSSLVLSISIFHHSKKNGTVRVVSDFRVLNSKLLRVALPIPGHTKMSLDHRRVWSNNRVHQRTTQCGGWCSKQIRYWNVINYCKRKAISWASWKHSWKESTRFRLSIEYSNHDQTLIQHQQHHPEYFSKTVDGHDVNNMIYIPKALRKPILSWYHTALQHPGI
jgi:hypothetical protein